MAAKNPFVLNTASLRSPCYQVRGTFWRLMVRDNIIKSQGISNKIAVRNETESNRVVRS